MNRERKFWLMKTEPYVFSLSDLERSPKQTAAWDGVRNYQARNFLRDEFKPGDGVLFYHSSVDPAGIAGEAVVASAGVPDRSAFDSKSPYYDPKSDRAKPVWHAVDVRFVRAAKELITLAGLKSVPALKNMMLLRRGCRLSVQPVTPAEWAAIFKRAEW